MFGGRTMLGFHRAQRSAGHCAVPWLGSATRPPAGVGVHQGSWATQGSDMRAGGCSGGGPLGLVPIGVISEDCGWLMPRRCSMRSSIRFEVSSPCWEAMNTLLK